MLCGEKAPQVFSVYDSFLIGHNETHKAMTRMLETSAKDLPAKVAGSEQAINNFIRYVKLIHASAAIHHTIEDMVVFPSARAAGDEGTQLIKEIQDHAFLSRKLAEAVDVLVEMDKTKNLELYQKLVPVLKDLCRAMNDPRVGHWATEEAQLNGDFFKNYFPEEKMTALVREMGRVRRIAIEKLGLDELDVFCFHCYHLTEDEVGAMLSRSGLPPALVKKVFPDRVRSDVAFWGSYPLYPKVDNFGNLALQGKVQRNPIPK